MCGCAELHLCIISLAIVVASLQVNSANVMSIPTPTLNVLKVHRATAYTILVEVPCQPFCSVANVKFMLKRFHSKTWEQFPVEVRSHPSHNGTFSIEGLHPSTRYYIRALLNNPGRSISGVYTPVLQAQTCPEHPPPVTHLRVVSAGPGWLDVRWTPPPKEACASDFEYVTRYKAAGGKFSPPRTYGVVPTRDGFIRIRPSHPCSMWPEEFCLLLVDDVQPGRNHTVVVQVHRLYGNKNEKAEMQSIIGYADPQPLVSNVLQGDDYSSGGNDKVAREDSVRTWFIVTVIALILIVVFTGVVLVLLQSGLLAQRAAGLPSTRHPASEPLEDGESCEPFEDVAAVGRRRSLWFCATHAQPLAFSPPPPYEEVAFLGPHTPTNLRTPNDAR